MKRKILCTICARGGSKGIRNKNIVLLCGKPLIAHTIEQALKWAGASRIIVSTDSPRIAAIAKQYGAQAPFLRPKELAGDNTPKLSAIRHAFLRCEEIYKEKYDIIVDLDISSPIRKVRDLHNCLKLFLKHKPITLFSVVKAHKNPYFNMVEQKKDGYFKLCKKSKRGFFSRQRAPKVYSMNASIYFYTRNFLLNSQSLTPLTKRSLVYVMEDLSRFDIDNKIDMMFIEFLMKKGVWKGGI